MSAGATVGASAEGGVALSLGDPHVWVGVAAIVILVFALIYIYHHVVYMNTTPTQKG